jgi:hypothetical protein
MAELFHCRVDAGRPTWERRLQMASNVAQLLEDSEVLAFLRRCSEFVESQTEGLS